MPLINCEVDLILTWSANYVSTAVANEGATFITTNKKTLCSSCDFISSRQCKIIRSIKISFS